MSVLFLFFLLLLSPRNWVHDCRLASLLRAASRRGIIRRPSRLRTALSADAASVAVVPAPSGAAFATASLVTCPSEHQSCSPTLYTRTRDPAHTDFDNRAQSD